MNAPSLRAPRTQITVVNSNSAPTISGAAAPTALVRTATPTERSSAIWPATRFVTAGAELTQCFDTRRLLKGTRKLAADVPLLQGGVADRPEE
jgi:hypothetical protein